MLTLLSSLLLLAIVGAPTVESIGVRECYSRLHHKDANFTLIVQCLARLTFNLTAHYEDTLWLLELLDRRLDRLLSKSELYQPTPYEQVDDILKIQGNVADHDCQGKKHAVQAIRRKLEVDSWWAGKNSSLFDWPKRQVQEVRVEQAVEPVAGNRMRTARRMDDEPTNLRCLIVEAIRTHKGGKGGQQRSVPDGD